MTCRRVCASALGTWWYDSQDGVVQGCPTCGPGAGHNPQTDLIRPRVSYAFSWCFVPSGPPAKPLGVCYGPQPPMSLTPPGLVVRMCDHPKVGGSRLEHTCPQSTSRPP